MPTASGRLRRGDLLERRGSAAIYRVTERLGLDDYAVRVEREDGHLFPWQDRMVSTALIVHAHRIMQGRDGNWLYLSPEDVEGPQPQRPELADVTVLREFLRRRGTGRRLRGARPR